MPYPARSIAHLFLCVFGIAWGAILPCPEARAQDCQQTSEGRICRQQQPITRGSVVDTETQRAMGLIHIAINTCSGTLLNRFWVLTARHCVTIDGKIPSPLAVPATKLVTADWSARVGVPSSFYEFAINRNTSFPSTDIILVYLGTSDLGDVDAQRIYATTVGTVLSGRLKTTDVVTQYGQGFSSYASGVFGTPSAQPAQGLGVYRSAQFSPSNIDAAGYRLAMNPSSQVGNGGDSGGPTVVTVNGVGVGIAGVQSTCFATGYLPGTPVPSQTWIWATGISWCYYVATEPFWDEIYRAKSGTPFSNMALFQRHADNKLWKYDNLGKCTSDSCPGWTLIDRNADTREIVTARGTAYQRHVNGKLWKYDGRGQCTSDACPGWTLIDQNRGTAAIVGGENGVYQMHSDRSIWRYDGVSSCTTTTCPGWTLIDSNGDTREIVAALGTVVQRHQDGGLWKYDGRSQCSGGNCPGWTLIDRNRATQAITGSGSGLYQLHATKEMWKYDGVSACSATACPGWTLIDRNLATKAIMASGNVLLQMHADNKLWKYDGHGQCTTDACPGWTAIDANAATREAAISGTRIYQRHADGTIWIYDGNGQCTPDACPGWTEIDHNTATAAIAGVEF